MASSMPRPARRDLTTPERRRLSSIGKQLSRHVEATEKLMAAREQVIHEVYAAGGSVEQMADALGVTKEAVYRVVRRSAS
jgi:transcriptional regulator of acetoin/glycerol metabolism